MLAGLAIDETAGLGSSSWRRSSRRFRSISSAEQEVALTDALGDASTAGASAGRLQPAADSAMAPTTSAAQKGHARSSRMRRRHALQARSGIMA
jgi:hypothetical protein